MGGPRKCRNSSLKRLTEEVELEWTLEGGDAHGLNLKGTVFRENKNQLRETQEEMVTCSRKSEGQDIYKQR